MIPGKTPDFSFGLGLKKFGNCFMFIRLYIFIQSFSVKDLVTSGGECR